MAKHTIITGTPSTTRAPTLSASPAKAVIIPTSARNTQVTRGSFLQSIPFLLLAPRSSTEYIHSSIKWEKSQCYRLTHEFSSLFPIDPHYPHGVLTCVGMISYWYFLCETLGCYFSSIVILVIVTVSVGVEFSGPVTGISAI